MESLLPRDSHGPTLDAGRIPGAHITWQSALLRDTPALRHERGMLRTMGGWSGFAPGLVLDDERIARVDHPTLLVYGSADPLGSVAVWRRLAGLLPRGQLHVVDGGGAVPWLDEPLGVCRRVHAFLTA